MPAAFAVLLIALNTVRAPRPTVAPPAIRTTLAVMQAPRPVLIAPAGAAAPVEPLSAWGWRRPLALGLGAGAVLLAGAGATLGIKSQEAQHRLSLRLAGGPPDAATAADLATARQDKRLSIGAFVGAGVGAAVACWLGFGAASQGTHVRLSRAGDGWGLALRGRF
jgi:hypothetical protein